MEDGAQREAEDVAADRRRSIVSGEVWDRFAAMLDRAPADVPGLAELMNTPTVLDDTECEAGEAIRSRRFAREDRSAWAEYVGEADTTAVGDGAG